MPTSMIKTPIKDLFTRTKTLKYYEDEMDRILFYVTNGDETRDEYSKLEGLLYNIDSIYEDYRGLKSFEEAQEKINLFSQKHNIPKDNIAYSVSNNTETGLLALSYSCYNTIDENEEDFQERKNEIYHKLFHLIIKAQRNKISEISAQFTYALFKTRFHYLMKSLSKENQELFNNILKNIICNI